MELRPEPLVGNRLRSTGLSGLPRAADLICVVVGVRCVDLEPRLHAVGAALGVRPTPRPLLLVEPVEDLGVVFRAAATASSDASIGRSA
jgi:hypothetical protein